MKANHMNTSRAQICLIRIIRNAVKGQFVEDTTYRQDGHTCLVSFGRNRFDVCFGFNSPLSPFHGKKLRILILPDGEKETVHVLYHALKQPL